MNEPASNGSSGEKVRSIFPAGNFDFLTQFFLYVVLVATAKLGLYIFYTLHTSPAVIWPPVGIALAAVFLKGYRMWLPIALSQITIEIISPAHAPLLLHLTSIIAYTLQPLLGTYLLRKLDFNCSFSRIRDAVSFVTVAIFLPIVASGMVNLMRVAVLPAPLNLWIAWSRAWSGGVLSILILTAFIVALCSNTNSSLKRKSLTEKTFACLAVVLASYITFWTSLLQQNVFLALSFLFLSLLWVGLRTGPKVMTIAMFLISFIGITGTIIINTGHFPLNQQLLANELFIALIAPIFLIFASLVEERRLNSHLLTLNIERLEQALKKISEEDQAKNDFLAILGHELRNPLASVISNLEVAKVHTGTVGESAILKHVDIAISHAGTMTHLLDDLLDVSRISKRKFKLQKQQVALQQLIKHATETVAPILNERSQVLLVEVPREPIILMADPLRLEQVVVNLLTNASKFSHKRGKISLKAHVRKNGEIHIDVRDEGIGIRAEKLKEIFEPFTQIPDKKGISNAGLGIGLSLTKRLVELHNGTVWAASKGLGHGSTITVILPMQMQTTLLDSLKTSDMKTHKNIFPQKKNTALGRKPTILVVDDNETAALGIATLLTLKGYTVEVVHTGSGALEQIRKRDFNVILLDIGLPDISGYEVAERLFKEYPGTPVSVIALTGFGQAEDKKKAKDIGFSHHLTKPVSISDIEAILNTLTY